MLFHARIAAEGNDRCGRIRHRRYRDTTWSTNSFADIHTSFASAETIHTAADQQVRWDELKKTEHGRSSVIAGVAIGQPAVALVSQALLPGSEVGASRSHLPGVAIRPPSRSFRLGLRRRGAAGEDPGVRSAGRAFRGLSQRGSAAAEPA